MPLNTKILIGGICEQDVDLFLLEEFVSNPRFLSWLLKQIPGWPPDARELLCAARSVDQTNGESDLELTIGSRAGCSSKLLIENKLCAGFQRQQLRRYRERAAMYVQRGDCAHSAVVLIAPSSYAQPAEHVDAGISYEAIEAWITTTDLGHRSKYKIELLRTALRKRQLGYNPETDQPVTNFWQLYWQEATVRAPELELEQPGPKPTGAGFIWFYPEDLPGELNICHKLPKGFVDLHFPGWGRHISTLKRDISPSLEPEMRIVPANKSAAVRLIVPTLNPGNPFGEQVDAIRLGLDAGKRLYSWANSNRARIMKMLAPRSRGV